MKQQFRTKAAVILTLLALTLFLQTTYAGPTLDNKAKIRNYLPTLKFDEDETWRPVDINYDEDIDVTNNPSNWDESYSKYRVYAHAVWNYPVYEHNKFAYYDIMEYWYYYVKDGGTQASSGHDQDWELHAMVWLLHGTDSGYKVRFGHHGGFTDYAWGGVEKEDATHVVAYIAQWSHASYRTASDAGAWPEWPYQVGFKLGWSNSEYYNNIIFVETLPTDHQEGIISGKWYCNVRHNIDWEGGHIYWDSTSENWWAKDYPGSGVAPWHRTVWWSPRATSYSKKIDSIRFIIERTENLKSWLDYRDIDPGVRTSLQRKLDATILEARQALTEAENGNDEKADTHMVASKQMVEALINEALAQRGKSMTEADADEAVYFAETIITDIVSSINWPGSWKN